MCSQSCCLAVISSLDNLKTERDYNNTWLNDIIRYFENRISKFGALHGEHILKPSKNVNTTNSFLSCSMRQSRLIVYTAKTQLS